VALSKCDKVKDENKFITNLHYTIWMMGI